MSHTNSSSELLSAVDAVAVISNLNPPRREGALYLQNEDGTRSGKFYFRDGYIYAAKVDGYEFPLAFRAAHSGLIDEDEQRSALASAGGDPSNPLLVSLYLQRHLLDQKTVESYLKENFLAVSGVLLSLNPVRAEWRDNETTEDFVVRYIDAPTLVSLCNKRANMLETAAERMGTTVDALFASPIKMLREVDETKDNLSVEAIWLLHKADGETQLDDAAAELGLTRLALAKLVYKMWNTGLIEVVATGTTSVQNEEVAPVDQDVVPLYVDEDTDSESDTEPVVDEVEAFEPIALIGDDAPATEPAVLEIPDPFEVQAEPAEQTDDALVPTPEDVAYPVDEEPLQSAAPIDDHAEDNEEVGPYDLAEEAEPVLLEAEVPSASVEDDQPAVVVEPVETPAAPVVPAQDDVDEDFARLTQAITSMTERARLANEAVTTATRTLEDARAAVRESEEEAADVAKVLERLYEEVRLQEERLNVAQQKVAQQRRQEEESAVAVEQAQSTARRLTDRLEQLRAAF